MKRFPGEMFPLIRAIFQDERIKNADVFALFRLRSVGLNRVPLEQAVLCSDGLLLLRNQGGQNAGADAGSLYNFEQFGVGRY